jgi:hypothetical protein
MSTDNYYRTAVLLQQDFGIVLMRQVNVLASTGVSLFIMSVMGYGRAADGGNYTMTILTQSAEYVELGMDGVAAISGPPDVDILDIAAMNPTCLVASSFTCGQIFMVTLAAECSSDDPPIADLSGNYQFAFTPQCIADDDGNAEPACDTFMDSLDGNDVALEVEAKFVDDCTVNLYQVTFTGDLEFYSDADLTDPVNSDSEPFVIGQDPIYGKVTVEIPNDPEDDTDYEFVEVSIEAVYVCTVDPDEEDLTVDDADAGTGGCLSSSIDADGPYNVIGTGATAKYEGAVLSASGNEATFSFLAFDTPRETIYVHVQLLLTMDSTVSGERRRRRVMLQTSTSQGNAFQSYIGSATVEAVEAETTAVPLETDGAKAICVGFVPALFVFIAGIFV